MSSSGSAEVSDSESDSDLCEVSETQFKANIQHNQIRNIKQRESLERVAMLYDREIDVVQQVRAARAAAESGQSLRLASLTSKLYGATSRVTGAWPTPTWTTNTRPGKGKAAAPKTSWKMLLLMPFMTLIGYLLPKNFFHRVWYRLKYPGQMEADLVAHLKLGPYANMTDVLVYYGVGVLAWTVYGIYIFICWIMCILWPRRLLRLIGILIMYIARIVVKRGEAVMERWSAFWENETVQFYMTYPHRVSNWFDRHKVHFIVCCWIILIFSMFMESSVKRERNRIVTWRELNLDPTWPVAGASEQLLRERNEYGINRHYRPPIDQASVVEEPVVQETVVPETVSSGSKRWSIGGGVEVVSLDDQLDFCDECFARGCFEPLFRYL